MSEKSARDDGGAARSAHRYLAYLIGRSTGGRGSRAGIIRDQFREMRELIGRQQRPSGFTRQRHRLDRAPCDSGRRERAVLWCAAGRGPSSRRRPAGRMVGVPHRGYPRGLAKAGGESVCRRRRHRLIPRVLTVPPSTPQVCCNARGSCRSRSRRPTIEEGCHFQSNTQCVWAPVNGVVWEASARPTFTRERARRLLRRLTSLCGLSRGDSPAGDRGPSTIDGGRQLATIRLAPNGRQIGMGKGPGRPTGRVGGHAGLPCLCVVPSAVVVYGMPRPPGHPCHGQHYDAVEIERRRPHVYERMMAISARRENLTMCGGSVSIVATTATSYRRWTRAADRMDSIPSATGHINPWRTSRPKPIDSPNNWRRSNDRRENNKTDGRGDGHDRPVLRAARARFAASSWRRAAPPMAPPEPSHIPQPCRQDERGEAARHRQQEKHGRGHMRFLPGQNAPTPQICLTNCRKSFAAGKAAAPIQIVPSSARSAHAVFNTATSLDV